MPAGELLANRVAETLSTLTGKTATEIGKSLNPPVTARAVRYAIRLLVDAGRAKRTGHPGQHFKVMAVKGAADANTGAG